MGGSKTKKPGVTVTTKKPAKKRKTLDQDEYLQRLKNAGMRVRVKSSALANEYIEVRQGSLKAQISFYPQPSRYGIERGRISKLWINDASGKARVAFDRGWDKESPESGEVKDFYDSLVRLARYKSAGVVK